MADELLLIASSDAVDHADQLLTTAQNPEKYVMTVQDHLAQLSSAFRTSVAVAEKPDLVATASDAEAAIELYGWLGELPPAVASQGRLWTSLAFMEFDKYMQARWPLIDDDVDNEELAAAGQARAGATPRWHGRVRSRWLLRRGTRSTLVRHGLARLWWAAHLTRDPRLEHPLGAERSDEWAYLRELFSKADRHLQIADRDAAMHRPTTFAILEHIAEDEDRATERYVRQLMVEVVLASGYKELSTLDFDRSREVVESLAASL